MKSESSETRVWKFKKGERLHLDAIYNIQGLENGTGKWWEHVPGTSGENVEILRDVNIAVAVTK